MPRQRHAINSRRRPSNTIVVRATKVAAEALVEQREIGSLRFKPSLVCKVLRPNGEFVIADVISNPGVDSCKVPGSRCLRVRDVGELAAVVRQARIEDEIASR